MHQAFRRNFWRRDQIFYWKVIVTCILAEFGAEHAEREFDHKILQQKKFYLNSTEEAITMNFLLLSVIAILIHELEFKDKLLDILESKITDLEYYPYCRTLE